MVMIRYVKTGMHIRTHTRAHTHTNTHTHPRARDVTAAGRSTEQTALKPKPSSTPTAHALPCPYVAIL